MRQWCMVALLGVLGCRGPSPEKPLVLIGALRHGLPPYLAAHPLAAGAEIRVDLVQRTSGASFHVVQIRGRERPHRHLEHDLLVHVLAGEGVLTLEGTQIPLGVGDQVVVERGAAHWFAAAAGTTAVALVTFAPPLDAPDSSPVVDSDDTRR